MRHLEARSMGAGKRRGMLLLLLGLAVLVVGWPAHAETQDPFEPANRKVFRVNDALDRWIVRPVAKGYDRLPDPLKRGIGNVFENLGTPGTAINQFLQGKPAEGLSDTTRFLVNTTFGLLGWFDVASKGGLRKHDEDFAQTFAVWGVGSGPFVMLPVLGPSTTTDTVGRFLDFLTDPVNLVNPDRDRYLIRGVDLVDTRARLLPAEKAISGDRYLFIRDAFLQRREYRIRDGMIEDDPFVDDEFGDFEDEYQDEVDDGDAEAL